MMNRMLGRVSAAAAELPAARATSMQARKERIRRWGMAFLRGKWCYRHSVVELRYEGSRRPTAKVVQPGAGGDGVTAGSLRLRLRVKQAILPLMPIEFSCPA